MQMSAAVKSVSGKKKCLPSAATVAPLVVFRSFAQKGITVFAIEQTGIYLLDKTVMKDEMSPFGGFNFLSAEK